MADLDGDKLVDLVFGSFDGRAYWARQSKRGVFEAPERMSDANGDELIGGHYWHDDDHQWRDDELRGDMKAHCNAVGPVDFDGDGDQDLLLGCYDGRIFLRTNDGDRTELLIGTENQALKHGRRTVFVKGKGAQPVAADWNGDGLFDLLSGSKSGGVLLWMNEGERGKPSFAAPVMLVPDATEAELEKSGDASASGVRTQIAVTDYDGDGDSDLLVGDYRRAKDGTHGYVWLYRRETKR